MTERVLLPDSIEDARAALASLGELATATEWHRAAIVYAFTEAQQGRRNLHQNWRMTIEDFAKLRISGLRSPTSVRFYRERWAEAMRLGRAGAARPGGRVRLPEMAWRPQVVEVPRLQTTRRPHGRHAGIEWGRRAREATDLLLSCLNAWGVEWQPMPRDIRELKRVVALAAEKGVTASARDAQRRPETGGVPPALTALAIEDDYPASAWDVEDVA